MKIVNYDFIDFGAGKGGCLEFASKKLGGVKGLGIDAKKDKCEILKNKGYGYLCADITTLTLPKKSVNFVTMSHFLEHLNSLNDVKKCIYSAITLAKNFIFIESPAFDFDNYLKNLGYKFFWSDWHGHKTALTIRILLNIFKELNITNYTFLIEEPLIKSTKSRDIHPLASPPDQFEYDNKIHPNKKIIRLDKHIFRSFICFIWLSSHINRMKLLQAKNKFKVITI